MNHNEDREPQRRIRRRGWVGALLLLVALSCALGREGVPPQGWWEGRGPVVPHESFPADCSLCHTGSGWNELKADFQFDHGAETGVVLQGAHTAAECLRCHNDRGPVAGFAARGCAGCHEDIHQGLAGNQCETCHGQEHWRPSPEIASHSRTRFPLVGAHAAAACWRCHENATLGRFDHADAECLACHRSDLARATTPDHLAQGWTSDCDRCHIPTTWTGGGFNHGGFPLTGRHLAANCIDCHVGGVFAGTPSDCVDCHLADYNGAQSPNHVALNISTDCASCHGTSGWQGANFNHTGISNGCVTCHLADYNGAQNPNHVAMNISTNCETCHDTSDWQGANFNHAGISNGCVACHQADYNGTTNPNHANAGFPTSCETCHGTNNWVPGNFQHACPLNGGGHGNLDCADCHLQPSNYQVFSCTHCHEHSQSNMNGEHSGVNNYVWSSPACYQCHPDGNE
ncbi:MAG: hypothetical protein IPK67_06650 [Planctomycetes bacterium]|nr:hypothetical protein [Planctomycetota bacterium]